MFEIVHNKKLGSFLNFRGIFHQHLKLMLCQLLKKNHTHTNTSSVSVLVVLQLLSCVWLLATPRTAACQASLSFTISLSLLTPVSTELVMPSNHLIIICHPLLLLPSIFPSIRVFSNESVQKIAKVVAFQLRSVVSDSSRPHGRQPARLLRPWDFPGKSTGVECHCLLRVSIAQHGNCYECASRDQSWSTHILWSSLEIHMVLLLSYSWTRQSQGYDQFQRKAL